MMSLSLNSIHNNKVKHKFLRVPSGLVQAPARFQEMMNKLLQILTFVKIYLNDVLVHTPGTLEEHLQALE